MELPGATVPPASALIPPSVPEPPSSAPGSTVTTEWARAPFTTSRPACTAVAPVSVPSPVSVRVPAPVLVRVPEPETALASVASVD